MALGALHLILNDLGFCRDFCHCELLREGRLKVSDRSVTRPRSVHGLMTCLSVKFGKYTEITISGAWLVMHCASTPAPHPVQLHVACGSSK